MKRILGAFILFFILTACNSQATQTGLNSTPSQSFPPTRSITATQRPHITPSVTLTSAVRTGTSKNTPKSTQSATPEPTPIQTKLHASIFDTPDPNGIAPIYSTVESPDGKWRIEFHSDFISMNYLMIFSKDSSTQWRINEFTVNDGGGYRQIDYRSPIWSLDGNYVYMPIGTRKDGWGLQYIDGEGMDRLNLKSGEITRVFGEKDALYSYTLSHDQSTLAFIELGVLPPLQIVLLDMRSGEKRVMDLDQDFKLAGWIRWSPDSQKFIFVATQDDIREFGYSYFLVDTHSNLLDARKILSSKERLYLSQWYINKGVLVVHEGNNKYKWSWLNPETGNLLEAKECATAQFQCNLDLSNE